MITESNGNGRLFRVRRSAWNEIVRWVKGVFSPKGTIEVTNTITPGEDGSLGLDVNIQVVAQKVKEALFPNGTGVLTRKEVKNLVWAMLDGASVVETDHRVAVNREWIEQLIAESAGSGVSFTNKKFLTGIAWGSDGVSLVASSVNLTVENGIVTAITENNPETLS